MKTIILAALTAALLLVAGCGSGNTTSNTSSDTTTSTSTTPALTETDVEGYFGAERSRRAENVSDNSDTALASVKSEDCTILSEGKARCIEVYTISSPYYGKQDTTIIWNVSYTSDGHILTYKEDK